jgi:hypothetical protein
LTLDRRLHGHVLHGRHGSVRVHGTDAEGRVWGKACTPTGKDQGPLVELSPDDWTQLERLLRRG